MSNFGDYDHGAFWFELEINAVEAAKKSTVLFIGNSRMQFGLSTDELDNWFRPQLLDYYLLGFSHHDNYLFFEPLLKKMKPVAEMYIINVDNFFEDKLTGPANSVMNEPDSFNRYRQKYYWQKLHKPICGTISQICGNGISFIRQRTNGAWVFKGSDFLASNDFSDQLVLYDSSVNQEILTNYASRAADFLSTMNAKRNCVVLTNIPNSNTSAGTASALAALLELPLVAPEIEGLTTFDGSHLDPTSAARWSGKFIAELAPHIGRCLHGSTG